MDLVELISDIIAQIDVFCTFSKVSELHAYTKPKLLPMNSGGKISLRGSRHPCVEVQREFIPNDIHMEKKKSSFVIVTGPSKKYNAILFFFAFCSLLL